MDRLSIQQGKMANKHGSVATRFFYKMLIMVKKSMVKMMVKTMEIDLMIARFDYMYIYLIIYIDYIYTFQFSTILIIHTFYKIT